MSSTQLPEARPLDYQPVENWHDQARATELAPRLSSHIPSLDGLRAVSIVFVIVAHLSAARDESRLRFFLPFGNLGVKIFFEISGFLITTLLLKEMAATGRVSMRGFYWRRVLRIFPAFYAYIGIICLLSIYGVIKLLPGDLLHAVTFTMNYHHARAWYLNHLWSLSVEEQFYLIWPALLCIAGARRSIFILVAVIAAAPLIRFGMVVAGAPASALTREFQAVADALAAGCLLAICFNRLGAQRRYIAFLSSPVFIPVVATGLLLPLAFFSLKPALFYIAGQSLSHICIALCIDRWVRFPSGLLGRMLNARPMAFIGALSYSLYLWQEPFLAPSAADSARALATVFPYNVLLLIVAALASYYLIERPFLKLKSRVKANSSRNAAASSPTLATGASGT